MGVRPGHGAARADQRLDGGAPPHASCQTSLCPAPWFLFFVQPRQRDCFLSLTPPPLSPLTPQRGVRILQKSCCLQDSRQEWTGARAGWAGRPLRKWTLRLAASGSPGTQRVWVATRQPYTTRVVRSLSKPSCCQPWEGIRTLPCLVCVFIKELVQTPGELWSLRGWLAPRLLSWHLG